MTRAGNRLLAESILLAVICGVVGALAGAAATAVYASSKSWAVVIPVEAWSGGIASAILIGAFAGLMPWRGAQPGAARNCCTTHAAAPRTEASAPKPEA